MIGNGYQAEHAIDFALELARLDRSEMDPAAAEVLLSARGDQLDQLLTITSQVRDHGLALAGREGVITYSKKVFLPITRLCRDRCHYCVFVESPQKLMASREPLFMSPEDIVKTARRGAALGCKEALFTLGDRPEDRWPAAKEWLGSRGYSSTLEYVRDVARLVLEETGLLPHLNPGVMSWSEMQRLRPIAPSMGMMLETTSRRLWTEKGQPHYGSPDKDPALRLRVLEDAGRSKIPFTTGVLIGIGETNQERADALFKIREVHSRFGHIQETIVQNFRAKTKTAMQDVPDLGLQEYVAAVAVARLVMGPNARIQAPPNLSDADELDLLIRAGVDDWGGVSPLTPDHVNPERPWPALEELERLTRRSKFQLCERLTAQPEYVKDAETWIDHRVREHVSVLAKSSTGLACENAEVRGRPWAPQEKRRSPGNSSGIASVLTAAADDPSGLTDGEYARLLETDGPDLEALCELADHVRRQAVGDNVTYAVNRNLDASLFTMDEGGGQQRLSPSLIARLVEEAHALGATEICIQGSVAPNLPGSAYVDLVRLVKTTQPKIHIHAFRASEILDGATRSAMTVREFLLHLKNAGLGTVPGSGSRILDDTIRATLSEGTDIPASAWVDTIKTAHSVGLRSTATMTYGHIETPNQQVAHMRQISAIQAETGGFTEFIAMPFLPHEAPLNVAKVARPGPTVRETRALHAVSRLLFHQLIDNVQVAWTKTGTALGQMLLQGGANDFGGLLLDGLVRPEAGAEAHRSLTVEDLHRIASELERPIRQRTTDYSEPVGHDA